MYRCLKKNIRIQEGKLILLHQNKALNQFMTIIFLTGKQVFLQKNAKSPNIVTMPEQNKINTLVVTACIFCKMNELHVMDVV